MIVVGLDISLIETGVARFQDEYPEIARIETWKVKSPPLGAGVEEMSERIAVTVERSLACIPDKLDLLVVERPLPARGGFASLQLERAAAYWMVVQRVRSRVAICDVHPKTRAKVATGNGNANKVDVLREVSAQWGGALGVAVNGHNVADAVALMGAGLWHFGRPLVEYSDAQLIGLGNIEWPKIKEKTA